MEGKILAAAREAAGLTQKDVATKLGYVSAQFISNAERGLCKVPKDKFKKLSKMLSKAAMNRIIEARIKNMRSELRGMIK